MWETGYGCEGMGIEAGEYPGLQNKVAFQPWFGGQSIENSTDLRLFSTYILYVVRLKKKVLQKGAEGHRYPRIPPCYALG